MQINSALIAETQSQNGTSQMWNNLDSQPVHITWGRLHGKRILIKSLDLHDSVYTVGRNQSNNISITLKDCSEKVLNRISNIHFILEKDLAEESNPVFIKDLSRNGTYVNGELIGNKNKQILLNNDVISLAHPNNKAFLFQNLYISEGNDLPENVRSNYHIGKKLGSGASGLVRRVYDRKTCNEYALKFIERHPLAKLTEDRRIMNEASIMVKLEHPCIIKIHKIIDNPSSVGFILDLMKGGDLLSRILKHGNLSEKMSKFFFIQICHAVKYLHGNKITHRDLKPDNILCESNDERTLIKLGDFGLSKMENENSALKTRCGTTLYAAPEILESCGQSYTNKVDIWSLGIVLFACLSGNVPFKAEHVFEQVKHGQFSFRSPVWQKVSPEAKLLILKMLTVNPNERPSINEVLKNRWLMDPECIQKAAEVMKINLYQQVKISDDFKPPAPKRRRVERK